MIKPTLPRLGNRLEAAIRLAGPIRSFADIGADHGLLSAALLQADPESHGYLTDISASALQKAQRLLERTGLSERGKCFVGDGFAPLRGLHYDAAFILGMGGDTVASILERGRADMCGSPLILSGHTHIPCLREAVYRIGYHITDEVLAREKDRFYFLLRCEAGREELPLYEELLLGRILPKTRPPEWMAYMQKQCLRYEENIASMRESAQEKDSLRLWQDCDILALLRQALHPEDDGRDVSL